MIDESPDAMYEVLWQDLCFSQNRHKIGIAKPSRYNMDVQVVSDSCSGHRADIHAYIISIGFYRFPQAR